MAPKGTAGARRPGPLESDDAVTQPGAIELLEAIRTTVVPIAARHAAEVDEAARFPHESFEALRAARALSAAVPRELGGQGCGMRELAVQCAAVAQGCSASGMILAMHHIQVACLVRHALDSAFFREFLRRLASEQLLIASVTSEVGTFGDTRSSMCAVARAGRAVRTEQGSHHHILRPVG